ncbi:hypothetical protein [Plastoroseomonas hellenica]|uniref:hypothetical protein n=1 Tax=Plastoroseomonas hellenica TaxID=2687306 RepID=UPI001BAD96C5|nr:hypothetical protein [Plastoroseomonas hellenica]MBR0647351.1 hypothetical protein [Plastoroseomonas hellenica]
MMSFRNLLGATALAFGLAACADSPPPVVAPTPPPVAAPAPPQAPAVADLVGARAVPGARQLTARGYRLARVRGMTRFYWHAAASTCVRTTVARGRFSVVEQVPPAACGR